MHNRICPVKLEMNLRKAFVCLTGEERTGNVNLQNKVDGKNV